MEHSRWRVLYYGIAQWTTIWTRSDVHLRCTVQIWVLGMTIQPTLITLIQGVAYVLARWFKCYSWLKLFIWVKYYDLFVLIWFLGVYFVRKVFQWDIHSLRKMTTSYKILDVKKSTIALYHKGLPCLQIGSKKKYC